MGSQGFLLGAGGSYDGSGGGGGGLDPAQVLAQPSKQQRPQSGQSRSGTPTDQQVECLPLHWSAVRGEAGGHVVTDTGGSLSYHLLVTIDNTMKMLLGFQVNPSGNENQWIGLI